MKDRYTGLSEEHFAEIKQRYKEFLDRLNDVDKAPTNVFKPLPQKALDDIALIREISQNLQNKKDEDVKKTQQAKEESLLQEAAKENVAAEKPETEKEN